MEGVQQISLLGNSHGHGNSMTELAQWGQSTENLEDLKNSSKAKNRLKWQEKNRQNTFYGRLQTYVENFSHK